MKRHIEHLHHHVSSLPRGHKHTLSWTILVIGLCMYLFMTSSSFTLGQPKTPIMLLNNTTYFLDGKPVTLVNGYGETVAPAERSIVTYFGNNVTADLNGDGLKDIVFIMVQVNARGDQFYYLASALYTGSGYKGGKAIFLGDHIAPQTTEVRDRQVVVTFATRNIGESLVVPPTILKSKYFIIRNNELTEVAKSQN